MKKELLELMKQRHSVRQYTDRGIESEKRAVLNELIKEINHSTGLHIQIFYDEPKCFDSMMAMESFLACGIISLWWGKSRIRWRNSWAITESALF